MCTHKVCFFMRCVGHALKMPLPRYVFFMHIDIPTPIYTQHFKTLYTLMQMYATYNKNKINSIVIFWIISKMFYCPFLFCIVIMF